MKIPTKIFSLTGMKFDDAAGKVTALFARFNDVDKQGDLTLPGAFGTQNVIIAAYGHGSWESGLNALPVGKGRIFENADGGVMEGQFFLDTTAGLETYKTVKNIGELQEWSYSLPEIDYEYRDVEGGRIRVLKKIRVNEVSPVLMGAGNGTQTLDIKSGHEKLLDELDSVLCEVRDAVGRVQDVAAMREAKASRPGAETMKRAKALNAQLKALSLVLEEIFERHDEAFKAVREFYEIKNRLREVAING